jgi:class 3 adenylate cyclase
MLFMMPTVIDVVNGTNWSDAAGGSPCTLYGAGLLAKGSLSRQFPVEALPELTLKGFSRPVAAFRLA